MINAYNYLVSSDYYKPQVKYNTHKKNELKNIYKDIMAISKDSPLYMFKLTENDQSFALSIKNYAGDINTSLDLFKGPDSVFNKSILSSSDDNKASIKGEIWDDFEPFTLDIHQLATKQQNVGEALYANATTLPLGTYKFGVTANGQDYEFEYQISKPLDNHVVQEQVADFINKTNIGINVELVYNNSNTISHLTLTSDYSGVEDNREVNFTIYDMSTVNGYGVVDHLGLDNVNSYPQNAKFTIDGTDYTSNNNTLKLTNGALLKLSDTTDTPITIGISPDNSYILNAVNTLASEYNSFIDFAKNSEINGNGPAKVTAFMKSAVKSMGNELEACGITVSKDGYFTVDEALLSEAAQDGSLKTAFTSDNGFVSQLKSRTELIGLNPMEYIKKTIVTYPNISRPGIANPYLTSVYSGMLFNQYC